MKQRRAAIEYSQVSNKFYVQIYGPSGRKAGGPIDISNEFWGTVIGHLESNPNGVKITETIPVSADDSVCLDPGSSQEVKVKLRGLVKKVHTVQIVSSNLVPEPSPSHE